MQLRSAEVKVLEYQLTAVRALRSAPDLALVRAALNAEEVLLARIASLEGEASNVVPMAANFAQRTEDPGER